MQSAFTPSTPITSHIATGLASAATAQPSLAAAAVHMALQRAGLTRAERVLLFLSADFAEDPRPALVAAARAAQTLAVSGCTALGLITESDWVLDAPSAAALVIGGDADSGPVASELTLAAPNTLDIAWLQTDLPRFGGVAGDATGIGPFKVWRQGQVQSDGRCTLGFTSVPSLIVSRGLRMLGEPLRINSAEGFDVQLVNSRPAAEMLRRAFRQAGGAPDHFPPLHDLAIAQLDESDQVQHSWPLISMNPDSSVTVATRLQTGNRIAWLQRTAQQALSELDSALAAPTSPQFGLIFSCGSRGAALHKGLDLEWSLLTQRFPGMPLLGFYGNGQIAQMHGTNQLLHHSVVVSLFNH